jgi:hypothetical protein
MAETRLHDERGVIGRSVQSLLVEPAADLPMRGNVPAVEAGD